MFRQFRTDPAYDMNALESRGLTRKSRAAGTDAGTPSRRHYVCRSLVDKWSGP